MSTESTDTQNKIDSVVKNNVKLLKDKIVATNHVFKLVRGAKSKMDDTTKENEALLKQIADLKSTLNTCELEKDSLKEELQKNTDSTKQNNEYETTIASLEAELNKSRSELNHKNMYVQQLEAKTNELKEVCEQQKVDLSASKAKEKQKQELAKKNNEIRTLKSKLNDTYTQLEEARREVQELNNQNESLQEEVTKLDDENMVLKIEKDMDSMDEEEGAAKSIENTEEIIALRKELDDCKEANSALIDAEKERTLKLDALSKKLKSFSERNTILEKAELKYQRELDEYKQRAHQLDNNKTHEELEKANHDLSIENKRLQELINSHPDSGDLITKVNQLEETNKQLKHDIISYKKKYQTVKDKAGHSLSINSNSSESSSSSSSSSKARPSRASHTALKLTHKLKTDLVQAKFEKQLLMNYILKEKLLKESTLEELLSSGESGDEGSPMSWDRSNSPLIFSSPSPSSPVSPSSPSLIRTNSSGIHHFSPTTDAVSSRINSTSSPTNSVSPKLSPDSVIMDSSSSLKQAKSSKMQPPARRNSGYGSSGLIAPPPVLTTSKPKKKNVVNKLTKFVNSKNPRKLITGSSLPAPMTPSELITGNDSQANNSLTTSPSKRSFEEIDDSQTPQVDHVAESLPTETINSPSSEVVPTTPVSSASPKLSPTTPVLSKNVSTATAPTTSNIKKRKIETGLLKTIDEHIKAEKCINIDEITLKDVDKVFIEIIESFSSMKSGIFPEASSDNAYGIKDQFTIQVPNNFFKGERDYAWYLCLLSTKDEFYNHIINTIIEKIKFDVKGTKREGVVARWIRLAALVTKSKNDSEKMVSILSDMAGTSFGKRFFCTGVLNVTRAFSDCLKSSEGMPNLPRTLQVALAHVGNKTTSDNASTIYTKIAPVLEWPEMDKASPLMDLAEENLELIPKIKEMKNDDTNGYADTRKCLNQSLKIIFNTLGDWKLTYNGFIISKLWPLLGGGDAVVTEIVVELLGSLGSLGVSEDVLLADKPGVDFLRDTLSQLVKMEDEEHKTLREIAAQSIAKLH